MCITATHLHDKVLEAGCVGIKDNNNCAFRFDVVEEYDNKNGFMAMEKWTGWHASIVMIEILNNNIDFGAIPIEKALSGKVFYDRALKRSYNIKIQSN